jgi:hypothetical protein
MTGQDFYRSRVVLADCAGEREAFGPVHTLHGLQDLCDRLEVAGWVVHGHTKLTSVAKFREHPAAWEAIARAAQHGEPR